MGACTEVSYAAFGKRLYRSAFRERIPIAGSLALTHRCNLDCAHCYLQNDRSRTELSARQWAELLDQLARAGCLYLILTGGEPMLHEDFEAIYRHAVGLGILVIVFTNGTQIDDARLALFGRWPPHSVEISVYGLSAATCEAVCARPEAGEASLDAARRLQGSGVAVQLKTMALRRNVHELDAMHRRARELGIPFRLDSLVTPCLDGDRRPLAERLDEEDILSLDFQDARRRAAWRASLAHDTGPRRRLYTCGAGRISFHVHPDGMLAMCMCDLPRFDLTRGSFEAGWDGALRTRRAIPLPAGHPCAGCRDQAFCGLCPPIARMESGSELGLVPQLCRLGKRRRDMASRDAREAGGGWTIEGPQAHDAAPLQRPL